MTDRIKPPRFMIKIYAEDGSKRFEGHQSFAGVLSVDEADQLGLELFEIARQRIRAHASAKGIDVPDHVKIESRRWG